MAIPSNSVPSDPSRMEALVRELYVEDESIEELTEDAKDAIWALLGHGFAGIAYGKRDKLISKLEDGTEIIPRQSIIDLLDANLNGDKRGPQTTAALRLVFAADKSEYYRESEIKEKVADMIRNLDIDRDGNITQQNLIAFHDASKASSPMPVMMAAAIPTVPPTPASPLPVDESALVVPPQDLLPVPPAAPLPPVVPEVVKPEELPVAQPVSEPAVEKSVVPAVEAQAPPVAIDNTAAAPVAAVDNKTFAVQRLTELRAQGSEVDEDERITALLNLREILRHADPTDSIKTQFADLFGTIGSATSMQAGTTAVPIPVTPAVAASGDISLSRA